MSVQARQGGRPRAQADLVLSSIGYRSVPLEGAPFDAARGVLANRRVLYPNPLIAVAPPVWGLLVGIAIAWSPRLAELRITKRALPPQLTCLSPAA